ncbi:lactosylceramide 4-alpha-galactosyltransferase-like [Anopheles albimanus]|uniref:lactosylceramide 4-alpha-galactosyltransferase-like n=1 Tax=Anopheles albimanus TaxID=7167 RepID=UPI0016403019|nr:lactosylceramide 4-alpha-galactosyltransferase-like [Anopheles albimanus]
MIYRSKHMSVHLSDVMRYLTLFKYGGTYLDLDVVVMKSFDSLEPNFAGAESEVSVANGVMGFGTTGPGHELAEKCVPHLSAHFDDNSWAGNGPEVISLVLQKYCDTNKPFNMSRERCRHFTVHPPKLFYAIYYPAFQLFFEERSLEEALAKVNESIAIHVWNKLR